MTRPHHTRLFARPLEDRLAPATWTVTNNFDGPSGSLRAAINSANASAGADTVIFAGGVVGTITLTLGDIFVWDTTTVKGPGAKTLTVSGNNAGRIFNVTKAPAAATLTVSGLTLTAGKATGNGGAILGDNESVALVSCVLSGNSATGSGGAVALQSGGSLTASDCTFSGNSAGGAGGAVATLGGGAKASYTRCTFNNNTAANGGAIHADFFLSVQDCAVYANKVQQNGGGIHVSSPTGAVASAQLINSTVSGNVAGSNGGGIALDFFNGTLDVKNSTVAFNSAGAKGGGIAVVNGGGLVNLESSILTKDSAPVGPEIYTAGTVNYKASALYDTAGIFNPASGGGNLAPSTNVKLDPLGSYGGPTKTHRLQAGSPAINVGSNALALVNDQRGPGFPRVVGAGADMGAYERGLTAIFPTVTAFAVNDGSAQRSMITSLHVRFTEPVTLPQVPGAAIRLELLGPVPVVMDDPNVMIDPDSAGVIIDWKPGGALPLDHGSLPNGQYRLTLLASQVTGSEGPLDGNGDGVGGDNYVVEFHRLAGDADGDRDVDTADFAGARAAFGGTAFAYDLDGDGDVDANDIGLFRRWFGSVV